MFNWIRKKKRARRSARRQTSSDAHGLAGKSPTGLVGLLDIKGIHGIRGYVQNPDKSSGKRWIRKYLKTGNQKWFLEEAEGIDVLGEGEDEAIVESVAEDFKAKCGFEGVVQLGDDPITGRVSASVRRERELTILEQLEALGIELTAEHWAEIERNSE